MALTSGDILVYDGAQWNNQPSTSGSVDLPGPFSVDSPTFYVDPTNDRVGIGTASPSTRLHVVSPSAECRIGGSAADQSLNLTFYDNNTTRKGRVLYAGGNPASSRYVGIINDLGDYLFLGTLNSTEIRFWTNGTERMRLSSDGNLGIGTTSPDFKLDISGEARISSSNKLYFGGTGSADNDTNLYRGAADQLQTDDALSVAGAVITPPSTLQTLAAGNAISADAAKVRVAGSGGAVTLTSTPTVADGSDGQFLMILGTSDTNTVTVQDQGTLAGTNLELGAGTRVLGKGDILVLSFDSSDSVWYEVCFANN
jgi:hypothetical protein